MVEEKFYKSEKKELEDRLILLRGQFEDQENANKRQRQLLEKYFNFARYAKEDFESDDDLKKKEVLAIVVQTYPERMKKEAVASIISSWYALLIKGGTACGRTLSVCNRG